MGYQIDQSGVLVLKVSNPAVIENAEVSLDSGSDIINQVSGLRIDFWSPIPLEQGCIIKLSVPQDFSGNLYENLNYIYAYGMFGAMKSLPFTLEQEDGGSSNIIVIKDACNSFLINDSKGTLKIKYLKNPDSVRDTDPFSILIADAVGNTLAQTPPTLTDSLRSTLIVSKDQFRPGTLA